MKPASRLAIQIPATRARLVPRPPRSAPAWLSAPHLQQHIVTALHRERCVTPLFTLAGSGKTTLLVEWIHLARGNTVAVTRWAARQQNVTNIRATSSRRAAV